MTPTALHRNSDLIVMSGISSLSHSQHFDRQQASWSYCIPSSRFVIFHAMIHTMISVIYYISSSLYHSIQLSSFSDINRKPRPKSTQTPDTRPHLHNQPKISNFPNCLLRIHSQWAKWASHAPRATVPKLARVIAVRSSILP